MPDASEDTKTQSSSKIKDHNFYIPNQTGEMTRLGHLKIQDDGQSELFLELSKEEFQNKFSHFFTDNRHKPVVMRPIMMRHRPIVKRLQLIQRIWLL